MSSGSWSNSDGLYIQYGTTKAVTEVAGDYVQWGDNRLIEATISLSSLNTSSGTIVSNTLFFPAGQNLFIEKVELVSEVPMTTTGSPTLSIGLIQDDRVTVPPAGGTSTGTGGATAFVAGITSTSFSTAGYQVTLYPGVTGAGSYIGQYNTQWNTNSFTSAALNSAGGYLTAQLGTTTATGQIKCRIYYHGVGTIPY